MDIRVYLYERKDVLEALAQLPWVWTDMRGGADVVTCPADLAEKSRECLAQFGDLTYPTVGSFRTFLVLKEYGGGWTNTGEACVVCGMRGHKLPPEWVGAVANGTHARFQVQQALIVEVSQGRGSGSGVVSHVRLDSQAPLHLGVLKRTLFEFTFAKHKILRVDRLDEESRIPFPRAAVDAAVRKCQVYHCRNVYYADVDVPEQQDGPRNRAYPKKPLGY